jgi:hypothetical protein
MVRLGEVNWLKRERLGAVVAHVSKGDWQGDPPEGNGLFTWDHSVEQVWLLWSWSWVSPNPSKVSVHEVEAAPPIHKGLSESGCPDQRINNEGKPPRLRDAIRVVMCTRELDKLSLRDLVKRQRTTRLSTR